MTPNIASIPLAVEQDRPFINLDLTGSDGRVRTIRCWVDTGGSYLSIREEVARELGLTWPPPYEGTNLAPVTIPRVSVGGLDLDLAGARVLVELGTPRDSGVQAEGFLGGQLLARYQVVFDYPNRTFTMATPGAITPRGVPVHTPHQPPLFFPRLEAEIDGEVYGLLLDTGATCTMISTALLDKLAEKHPDWPHAIGAAGVANCSGGGAPAGQFREVDAQLDDRSDHRGAGRKRPQAAIGWKSTTPTTLHTLNVWPIRARPTPTWWV